MIYNCKKKRELEGRQGDALRSMLLAAEATAVPGMREGKMKILTNG